MKPKKTLQLTKWLVGISTLVILATTNSLHAQGWETVLDYQSIAGNSTGGDWGAAADSWGNAFVGGLGTDASGLWHGIILQTDTTASTWRLSGDLNPPAPYTGADVRGLGFDASGNLYWSGQLWGAPCSRSSCPGSVWFVHKSADRGQTWTTVETFQYAPGASADPRGVVGDLSGNIFVCGNANDAKGVSHWLVRKSNNGEPGTWSSADDVSGAVGRGITYVPGKGLFAVGFSDGTKTLSNGWMVRRSVDSGATWSTIDLYQLPKQSGWYQDASALGVAGDAQGNIYVVGGIKLLVTSGRNSSAVAQWLIRRSTDGGAHWETVDTYPYVSGQEASAWGISQDAAGSVVAVGRGHDAQGITHWLVRRPDPQGVWHTVDDYQLAPGNSADATAVVRDAAENVFVNGEASDAGGGDHWIVRRLAAP